MTCRAKNASRGGIATSGSTVHEEEATTGRGVPRCRSTEAVSTSQNRARCRCSSAIVAIATIVSRSAISTAIPASIRSCSTAWPCAPVPASSTTSLVGSTAGPCSTRSPGTSDSRARAAPTTSSSRADSCSPCRASSTRAASMLAAMVPDGLVVWVASNARSSRSASSRSVRASTIAAWV